MSIESHLVSLRTYLEEVASQNKQIIGELKRTNELLAGQQKKPAEKSIDSDGFVMGKAVNVPKEAVGPVTVETVEVVDQHGNEHKPIGDTGIFHVPSGTVLKPKGDASAGTESVETEPPPDAHLAAVTQRMDTPPEVDAIMPAPAASKPATKMAAKKGK